MAIGMKMGSASGIMPEKIPEYTGTYSLYGDEKKGYMELKSSGTLSFPSDKKIDIFLVGGGQAGQINSPGENVGDRQWGGNGGETQSFFNITVPKNSAATVTIGTGGTKQPNSTIGGVGTQTQIKINSQTYTAKAGTTGMGSGGGGRAYSGSSDGQDGKAPSTISQSTKSLHKGQNRTTKPFNGDVSPFNTMVYSGGGGGGGYYEIDRDSASGGRGANGGGDGGQSGDGTNALANTGSGGGGAGNRTGRQYSGGYGGSGIAIIRWGY